MIRNAFNQDNTEMNKGELIKQNTELGAKRDRMLNEQHIGQIIQIAADLVEMGHIKVKTDAVLKKMEEDRKMLLAEAEAYAIKKNADTSSVVERVRVVRDMLNDFYQYNIQAKVSMSGEEFTNVIKDILENMSNVG